jgi:predicted nucleic acid-binding protein
VIVLDATALVDVLTDQPSKSWVLSQLRGQDVVAPAHQPAEVLSAIARLQRGGVMTKRKAREALQEAMALPQELIEPDVDQVVRALDLQGRIRVLDGLYVALAESEHIPLLTTDQRLARSSPPCDLISPP